VDVDQSEDEAMVRQAPALNFLHYFVPGTLGPVLIGHRDAIWGIEFSPDGLSLASGGSDNTVILWDIRSSRAIGRPLERHSGTVRCVAFRPDGKALLSCGDDGALVFWKVDFGSWREAVWQMIHRDLTPDEWSQFVGEEPYQPIFSDQARY
jgi:WD40 repeat protein